MKKNRISLAYALLALIATTSQGATSLTQYGITWNFNADHQSGQYANGDYWVVGPVTITNITPASTVTPSQITNIAVRIMNGSQLNPLLGDAHGYDNAPGDMSYNPALNAGRPGGNDLSPENPLVISCGSLISSISKTNFPSYTAQNALVPNRPQVKVAAILTVVTSAPPVGAFRPPPVGSDKTSYWNQTNLNYSILKSLTPPANMPALATVVAKFERPWLEQNPGWTARYIHPEDNQPTYGREIAHTLTEGLLSLHMNYTPAQKETLYIRLVQYGIDVYGTAKEGGVWEDLGGHNPGRKMPLILAGMALNDTNILAYANAAKQFIFQEDRQTWYVIQADVGRALYTADGRPRIPYIQADVGIPEWGEQHARAPIRDGRNWDAYYRSTCYAVGVGQALVAHLTPGAVSLWNWPAFFDYMDRAFGIEGANASSDANTIQPYVANTWNSYRYLSTPSASFTVSANSGIAPLTVSFTDTSAGDITNHFWSFGDGAVTNTTATSVSHTYTVAGTNTVQLIVSGSNGASTNTQVAAVTVTLSAAPVAGFSGTPTSGTAPLEVTFTDTSTGSITNRFWSFGDGGTTNTTATSISHTYTVAGTKTVQLIVSGIDWASTNTQINLISVATGVPGTLLLQETFTHTAGAPLIGTTPETGSMWATNGTGTGIKSNVVAGSLSAPPGFVPSSGNSVKTSMSSEFTGKEMHSRFTAQTGAGAVTYLSFLVNVDAMAAGKSGGVIALSDNSGAEYAHFFITNTVGNSFMTFGLGGRSTGSGPVSSAEIALNTTHLIVLSYEITSGSGNDIMKMWVDPTSFGGTEPAYDLTLTGFTDVGAAGLNTLELKNGSAAPRVIIDELRVGPTWAGVTPMPISAPTEDTDSDGIPDSWETQHFGGATNANSSALAANGLNTIYETYIAGLNPTNTQSVFALSGQQTATQSRLQWSAVSGRVYSVYWTTNLLSGFQPLETNIVWPQNSWTDTVHGAQADGFYKIKVQLGQ